jgi:hypothetical protein
VGGGAGGGEGGEGGGGGEDEGRSQWAVANGRAMRMWNLHGHCRGRWLGTTG